ncbi:uncharacterized protein BO88DRAFT_409399, partial [Aspergillus vadensis CBS 113365]
MLLLVYGLPPISPLFSSLLLSLQPSHIPHTRKHTPLSNNIFACFCYFLLAPVASCSSKNLQSIKKKTPKNCSVVLLFCCSVVLSFCRSVVLFCFYHS